MPNVTFDLPGRVALVTGAARGIGLATARLLHERGASVALVDLDADGTAAAAAGIGERALAVPADVTDRDAMSAAVTTTVERFGRLDVVVANAGIAPPAATMRVVDPETFERVVEVDLLGVWRTVRPALPEVVARRGHVAVVSSISAWANGAALAAYGVSKAGVEQLGRALRTELAPSGASAGVVYFGFVDTEMLRAGYADPVAHAFEELLPGWMRRRVRPDQAAAAIVRGIERRARSVVLPSWWRAWSALRGLVNPAMDRLAERDPRLRELIREADRDERAALRQ